MKILIACEFSGIVREAFRRKGHEAISCDLKPTEIEGPHVQGDVLTMINDGFDLMIAHPPCTYLCSSGLHWNCRMPGRAALTRNAIDFVEKLWAAPISKIALENPIGCLPTHSNLMKYDQVIQPHYFGEDASKDTCLWLKNLPILTTTKYIQPRIINGKERWSNQTDSGQNKLTPSEERSDDRSRTYQGIADAMAEQWTNP